jgi:hypothetical protein
VSFAQLSNLDRRLGSLRNRLDEKLKDHICLFKNEGSLGDGNAEGPCGSGALESVRVLDVSDPAGPRTVRNFDGVTSILQDSARDLLYVANGAGIWIVSHQQVVHGHECNSSDALSDLPNCD